MNESREITLLRARSLQARAMAGQARRVGSQEQQISAYCLAEALELRLEQLLNTDAIGPASAAGLAPAKVEVPIGDAAWRAGKSST